MTGKKERYETCVICGFKGLHEYQPDDVYILGDITTTAGGYFCWECYEKRDFPISKCGRCGKEVYFDKHPEYDVCSRCEKHICVDCGTPDLIQGDSMCKEHKKEVAK